MTALIDKLGAALGVVRPVSRTDLGIIEAMIEIGASNKEIADTFGYSDEAIDEVRAHQASSPYRVPPP